MRVRDSVTSRRGETVSRTCRINALHRQCKQARYGVVFRSLMLYFENRRVTVVRACSVHFFGTTLRVCSEITANWASDLPSTRSAGYYVSRESTFGTNFSETITPIVDLSDGVQSRLHLERG